LVHLPQSLDAVLAALAVLRAGGAWWLAEPDGAVATVGAVADDLACAGPWWVVRSRRVSRNEW
ncbi:hypothetical protein, partial [Nocardia carnea]|uniref:hypothetical protein n=1 Tax=Nocardia carnea TaxID=37328 RepID=UPI0024544122